MTVNKTQKDLGVTLKSTEQVLDGLERAQDSTVGASLLANNGLPEGWVGAPIGEVAGIFNGRAFKQTEWAKTGLPIIRIQNLNKPTAMFNYFEGELDQRHFVQKGDLLFAWSGTPGTSFGAHEWKGNDAALNQHIFKIDLNENRTSKIYFRYAMNHKLQEMIGNANGGVGLRHITKKTFETTLVSYPPLAEQTIIAQTLDTLLAQVDNIKTRLDAIPKILKTFRQSVLAAAVSGKLTEEWRRENECESAAELLDKLKTARSEILINEIEGGNKETKRLFGKISKHVFSKPIEVIPEDWVWTSFMDSMEKVVDCHNKTAPYIEKGIPLIRTPDIRDGKISLKGARYISEETYNYWSRRCPPEAGDIILTREAPMGEAGIVPKEVKLCMGQRMMLLRPLPEYVNPSYVLLNILSLNFQIRMHKEAIGTGVKHLRVADVESLTYPMCSLKEQTKIVHRVEELFTFAYQIEQQMKNAQGRVNNLTQSILAKAFRGELSTQWRADNPKLISGENSAEALLEKIKFERETLNKQAKSKLKTVKKKTGSSMSQKIIKVVEALKQAGEPLNGQQLLAAAGYPSDSDTAELEKFFLDIREALISEKNIVKLERSDDSQDWFTLAEAKSKS